MLVIEQEGLKITVDDEGTREEDKERPDPTSSGNSFLSSNPCI